MAFLRVLIAPPLSWLACLAAASALIGTAPVSSEPGARARSLLFIGNSYTYVNNLPALVRLIGAAASEPFDVGICGEGGATLTMHLRNDACRRALERRHWDLVVLQEQSTLGGLLVDGVNVVADPQWLFWPGVRQWNAAIRERGAATALYLTWARRDTPGVQPSLTHAYMTIGREVGALVLPVGVAWQEFRRRYPAIPLYAADGSHPTPSGSYLAAATLVTALLDRKTPSARGPLVVHPAPDGVVDNGRSETLDVPDDVRVKAHGVAWDIWRDQKEAGGYLEVRAPGPPQLPSRPDPHASIARLAGKWVGAWRLLSPAWTGGEQELIVDVNVKPLHVAVSVLRHDGTRDQLQVRDAAIHENRLRFTATIGEPFPGPVAFECASRETGAQCLAERTAPEQGVRLIASWSGRPVE